MTFDYRAYGLTWRLPFPCPELSPAAPGGGPDVLVVEGPVPLRLPDPILEGSSWQAEPGRFLLRAGRRAGRFLVERGQRITLQRGPAAEDEITRFFLLRGALAAVLRQRGLLVLHANAVVTPSGAVIVAGPSGAGKSTTTAALVARGCPLLADDVTALRLGPTGAIEVLPGVASLHLLEEAAAGLGQDLAGLPRYCWHRMKVVLPMQARLAPGPAPLRALYLLDQQDADRLLVREIVGSEKFTAIVESVYGPLLPQQQPALFPIFRAMGERAGVFRIRRPAERWTVEEIADLLIDGPAHVPTAWVRARRNS